MIKTTLAAGAFALLTVFSTSLPTYAAGANPVGGPVPAPVAAALPAAVPAALSPTESASLQNMREEEKLAHDVYVTLYAKWGLRAFNNISRAEQRHTDAIVTLLNRYGVSDPAAGNAVGVFSNPDLQALYDKLVAQGSISTAEALKVGVLVEQTDIADLKTHIAETTKADILQVYNNLLAGSQNHLRAFSR
ncbi:MAG: DUF2202 domain-containing protein [Caldilineaceae bacterium]